MTTTEVPCPKCGGRTWDNRIGKKNPKAPDFKCRDKSCDGVVWPEKNGQPSPAISAAQQVAQTIPGAEVVVTVALDPRITGVYAACTRYVLTEIAPLYEKAGIGMSPESAHSAVFSVFKPHLAKMGINT